jgi:hypothetical protein
MLTRCVEFLVSKFPGIEVTGDVLKAAAKKNPDADKLVVQIIEHALPTPFISIF